MAHTYLDLFGSLGGYGGRSIFIQAKVALNAVASSEWLSACFIASVIRGSTKIFAAIAIPTGLKQFANAFTESIIYQFGYYSKTCLKQPLKNRQIKGFND